MGKFEKLIKKIVINLCLIEMCEMLDKYYYICYCTTSIRFNVRKSMLI